MIFTEALFVEAGHFSRGQLGDAPHFRVEQGLGEGMAEEGQRNNSVL